MLFLLSLCFIIVLRLKKNEEIRPLPMIFGFLATIAAALSRIYALLKERDYEKKSYRIFTCALALMLIVFAISLSGERLFSRQHVKKAENNMHIDESYAEIMQKLCEYDGGDKIRIFPQPGKADLFTAYSSKFICAYKECYGDVFNGDLENEMIVAYATLCETHPDMSYVDAAVRSEQSEYVILENGSWPEVPLENFGYKIILENDELTVYETLQEVKTSGGK